MKCFLLMSIWHENCHCGNCTQMHLSNLEHGIGHKPPPIFSTKRQVCIQATHTSGQIRRQLSHDSFDIQSWPDTYYTSAHALLEKLLQKNAYGDARSTSIKCFSCNRASTEGTCRILHLFLERKDVRILLEASFKILQLLAFLFLHFEGNLDTTVQVLADPCELRRPEAASCHRGSPNADTAR